MSVSTGREPGEIEVLLNDLVSRSASPEDELLVIPGPCPILKNLSPFSKDLFSHREAILQLNKKNKTGIFVRKLPAKVADAKFLEDGKLETCFYIPAPAFNQIHMFKSVQLTNKTEEEKVNIIREIADKLKSDLKSLNEFVQNLDVNATEEKKQKDIKHSAKKKQMLEKLEKQILVRIHITTTDKKEKEARSNCALIRKSVQNFSVTDSSSNSIPFNLNVALDFSVKWRIEFPEPSEAEPTSKFAVLKLAGFLLDNKEFVTVQISSEPIKCHGAGDEMSFQNFEQVEKVFDSRFDQIRQEKLIVLPDIDNLTDHLLWHTNKTDGNLEGIDHFSCTGETIFFIEHFVKKLNEDVKGVLLKNVENEHIAQMLGSKNSVQQFEIDWLFLSSESVVVFEIGLAEDPSRPNAALQNKLNQAISKLMPLMHFVLYAPYSHWSSRNQSSENKPEDFSTFIEQHFKVVIFLVNVPAENVRRALGEVRQSYQNAVSNIRLFDTMKQLSKCHPRVQDSVMSQIVIACDKKEDDKITLFQLDRNLAIKGEETSDLTKLLRNETPNESFQPILKYVSEVLTLSYLSVIAVRSKPLTVDERYAMGYDKWKKANPDITCKPKLILSPQQHRILTENEPFLVIQADPGCGKTLLLIEKARILSKDEQVDQIWYVIPKNLSDFRTYIESQLSTIGEKVKIVNYEDLDSLENNQNTEERVENVALLFDEVRDVFGNASRQPYVEKLRQLFKDNRNTHICACWISKYNSWEGDYIKFDDMDTLERLLSDSDDEDFCTETIHDKEDVELLTIDDENERNDKYEDDDENSCDEEENILSVNGEQQIQETVFKIETLTVVFRNAYHISLFFQSLIHKRTVATHVVSTPISTFVSSQKTVQTEDIYIDDIDFIELNEIIPLLDKKYNENRLIVIFNPDISARMGSHLKSMGTVRCVNRGQFSFDGCEFQSVLIIFDQVGKFDRDLCIRLCSRAQNELCVIYNNLGFEVGDDPVFSDNRRASLWLHFIHDSKQGKSLEQIKNERTEEYYEYFSANFLLYFYMLYLHSPDFETALERSSPMFVFETFMRFRGKILNEIEDKNKLYNNKKVFETVLRILCRMLDFDYSQFKKLLITSSRHTPSSESEIGYQIESQGLFDLLGDRALEKQSERCKRQSDLLYNCFWGPNVETFEWAVKFCERHQLLYDELMNNRYGEKKTLLTSLLKMDSEYQIHLPLLKACQSFLNDVLQLENNQFFRKLSETSDIKIKKQVLSISEVCQLYFEFCEREKHSEYGLLMDACRDGEYEHVKWALEVLNEHQPHAIQEAFEQRALIHLCYNSNVSSQTVDLLFQYGYPDNLLGVRDYYDNALENSIASPNFRVAQYLMQSEERAAFFLSEFKSGQHQLTEYRFQKINKNASKLKEKWAVTLEGRHKEVVDELLEGYINLELRRDESDESDEIVIRAMWVESDESDESVRDERDESDE